MKSRNVGLAACVGLLVLVVPTPYLMGYGTSTHATISFYAYKAAKNLQDNFFNALFPSIPNPQQTFTVDTEAHTALGWITAGSIREDTDPLSPALPSKSLFHFDDPQFTRGLHYVPPLTITTLFGVISASLSPSSSWATDSSNSGNLVLCDVVLGCPPVPTTYTFSNAFSFSQARTYFYNGLIGNDATTQNRELGLMFLSLGHAIHLLQDTAQPQHVRNDAHLELGVPILSWYIDNPSAYEHYVDATYSSPLQQKWATWAGSYSPTSLSLPQNFFADGSGRGLAEFTNAGFVSAGTNCTTFAINDCHPAGGYNLPIIENTTAPTFQSLYGGQSQCQTFFSALLGQFPNLCTTDAVTFVGNSIADDYTLEVLQNPYMSTYSIFDLDLAAAGKSPVFSLNHFNYDQQADFLLPRAVGYSAGLLNYFFRGSTTAQGGPSGFTIGNNTVNGATPETMNGTFSLYYDDQNGNRQMVPGANWSNLSIQGGGATSSSLTFTPPTNPAPAQPGQYILVFQGTMGAEDGAVSGAVVQLTDFTLTVSSSGTGSGTVTSSPAGVNCGATCVASFAAGVSVTLTAAPAAGSVFGGWGGDCASAGTSPSAQITLSASMSCSAAFSNSQIAQIAGSIDLALYFPNPGYLYSTVQVWGSLQSPGGTVFTISVQQSPPPMFRESLNSPGFVSCNPWEPYLIFNPTCQNISGLPPYASYSWAVGVEDTAYYPVTVTLTLMATPPNGRTVTLATKTVACAQR